MAFKLDLDPKYEPYRQADAQRREVMFKNASAFAAMSDEELADTLLAMARSMRAEFPDKFGRHDGAVYGPNYLWHVIPRIAHELCGAELLPNENTSEWLNQRHGSDFENSVGQYMAHSALGRSDGTDALRTTPNTGEILDGISPSNPVVVAMRRLRLRHDVQPTDQDVPTAPRF